MKIWKQIFLVVMISALILPWATAQEKVTLEYKYREGQTQYMLAVVQGQVALQLPESVEQGAMPPAFPMTMVLVMSMKTLKTYSDGAADIEIKVVDGKMSVMGVEQSFMQSPQGQQFPQTVRIRVGKRGNLIKLLTPLTNVQTNILAGFDTNMMIQNLSRFALLPEQEVGVGDKWEIKMDTDLLPFGKLNILQKMTLTSFEKVGDKNCAKISMEVPPSTFQLNIPLPMGMPGATPEGQEVPTMPMNGQIEMKGDMLFDYQNGNMVSQNGTLKMILNMAMPTPGAAQGPYQINANINMKFKINFSEKKPELPTPAQIQQMFQAPQEGQA